MGILNLNELNNEQNKAVSAINKPVLILAGAGSGKTRVITYKIAYLILHDGIDPGNILAVTFTKKAATEMKERVMDLLVKNGAADVYNKYSSACMKNYRVTIIDDSEAPWLHLASFIGLAGRFDTLAIIMTM